MYYRIKFHSETGLILEADMLDDYYYRITGDIYFQTDEMAEGDLVGSLLGYHILSSLANVEGASIEAAFNQEDADLGAAYDALADAGVMGDVIQDILVLDHIVLDSAHRGQDLALHVARGLVRVHGSDCRHFIIDALPEDYADTEDEEARQKLEAHFARLGAVRLPTPGFLLLDLQARQPVLESGEFLPRGTEVSMFDRSTWWE